MSWRVEKIGNLIHHRKEFITIDDAIEYKRCRVQVNRKGVILRDIIKGISINTKKTTSMQGRRLPCCRNRCKGRGLWFCSY